MVVRGVPRQVSYANASADHYRKSIVGTPFCTCRIAGSHSRKLANASPVPSLWSGW